MVPEEFHASITVLLFEKFLYGLHLDSDWHFLSCQHNCPYDFEFNQLLLKLAAVTIPSFGSVTIFFNNGFGRKLKNKELLVSPLAEL